MSERYDFLRDFFGTGPQKSELRDYFAAGAMQGAMANPTFWREEDDEHGKKILVISADLAATNAYIMADAMLKERAKP